MNTENKIQTFSIVSGTEACNARCNFCVARMTPPRGIAKKEPEIPWDRFTRALNYAKDGNADTAMITSKGEPTLFPGHITDYLEHVMEYELSTDFSFRSKELQTNGIIFEQKPEKFDPLLARWKDSGLETVAISVVHFNPEKNREIYLPYAKKYIELPSLIKRLHGHGLRARLACVMVDGYIDTPNKVAQLIDYSQKHDVEELTIRPVNKPEVTRDDEVSRWIAENYLRPQNQAAIEDYLEQNGSLKKKFPFGAKIYDMNGQNICLTNSLTKDNTAGYSRQLIFYPSGIIATDWTADAKLLP